ncbi:MAG: adenylosuccinate lyase [Halobacteriales archaeon]|nr:adenylosuccinate lyase [Halobacteriales archaeon]
MYHTDGVLFKNAFGTPAMREIMSEARFVERFLDVEAALARAEADIGLIPEEAAAEITEKASLEYIDFDDIEQNVADIHLFTMAIIGAWKEQVGEAGEYIHWGATSQDISDTAMLLQLREGYEELMDDLTAIRSALAALAEEHADTPMIGRTHHMHAIPITFGLKAATWLDELDRGIDRLEAVEDRLFALEFFGATGTLASIGEPGLEVQERMADELDLDVPDVAWYAARDRFAELVSVLATIAGTLSRIARNVLMMNRPEFEEVKEPIAEGKVGSSTMPHKRNPVKSEETVALARLIRGHADVMQELMEPHDERDYSTWVAEFAVLPETFLYTSRMCAHMKTILEDLIVNPERMAENLEIYGSLVTSEAVMMALAERVGRQTAHDILHEAAMAAIDEGEDFAAALRDDDRVMEALSEEELADLTDPMAYTGVSAALTHRALDRTEQ